ncbi:hypothetical protein ACH4YO_00150 [Streptomyces noursei]|uniref:hypothetical protein n=1 Tax=Streptomyces noursei TaxID=1971 RepID=UPI003400CF35
MRIVITGASGFLGHLLADALLATRTFLAALIGRLVLADLPVALSSPRRCVQALLTLALAERGTGPGRLPWTSRLTTPVVFALAHLLLAAGLTGYAPARTLPGLRASAAVWSLGDLLVMGRAYGLVTDLAPPGGRGRHLAVFGTSWGVAATLAPLLGTQLLARAGTTTLWSAVAALCLLLAVFHLRVTPKSPSLCNAAEAVRRRVSGAA